MKVFVLEAKADEDPSWYVQGVYNTWNDARNAAIKDRVIEYENDTDDLFYTRISCLGIEFLITSHEVQDDEKT